MTPDREALRAKLKAEAQNSCRSLGQRSWASISGAQMLSECFFVLPSIHGGKSEYTRHKPPGAARPTAASRLRCSPLTQASPFGHIPKEVSTFSILHFTATPKDTQRGRVLWAPAPLAAPCPASPGSVPGPPVSRCAFSVTQITRTALGMMPSTFLFEV